LPTTPSSSTAEGYRLDSVAGRAIIDSRPFQIFEGSNDVLYDQIAALFLGALNESGGGSLAAFLARHERLSALGDSVGEIEELPLKRFLFVGNGALLGARLVALSKGMFTETGRIARMMTNIELSVSPRFMDEFMAAQFLPHTDHRAFPRTTERLRKMRSGSADSA